MRREAWSAIGGTAVLLAVALACDAPRRQAKAEEDATSATVPLDDAKLVIARCGTPAKDDSTANDNPRPPIPTRILDYPKAKLHVVFLPAAKMGEPPPYRWRFLALTDMKTDEPVHVKDALKRLPCLAGDAGFPFDAGK